MGLTTPGLELMALEWNGTTYLSWTPMGSAPLSTFPDTLPHKMVVLGAGVKRHYLLNLFEGGHSIPI